MAGQMTERAATGVLFVCLGNICRSPTAHAVFEARIQDTDFAQRIIVDSCGTGGWHVGEPPDRRATETALRRGYDLSSLRARQVSADDFEQFEYILAMDRQNLSDLNSLKPANFAGHLGLFLDFVEDSPVDEVPDPYYGGVRGFDEVLDLVESASDGLMRAIADAN